MYPFVNFLSDFSFTTRMCFSTWVFLQRQMIFTENVAREYNFYISSCDMYRFKILLKVHLNLMESARRRYPLL